MACALLFEWVLGIEENNIMRHFAILDASLNGNARATGTVTLLLVLSLLGVAAAGERPHETAEREVAFGVELAPRGIARRPDSGSV